MPSILPIERFFESFRLPAGSLSMTQLLAHIFSNEWSPCGKRGATAPSIYRRNTGGKTPGSAIDCERAQVSRQQVGVLLLMFNAQRQVRLRRDAVDLV